MNINMDIPGLKGVNIDRLEQMEERIVLHVSLPKQAHICPACGLKTAKVHDYRMQKVKHLKWFERLTTLFYKRRRYACACVKRFSEENPFVERYQRFSKEANQVMRIRSVKANNSAFLKAIKMFKNWQVEILNSYAFNYSNGFLEGINNTSKVMKRNAYGFRKYEHFKAKVLLTRLYKNIGVHIG